ncbi:phospholipase D-like domain-containing protein [Geotalea sp. SG265]|uniref:phospholipase D-like domain-containing protein n=1 Tax=Geotalea sp. SG265 TaxID=2922867 RepID=UPI001FAFDAA8|nr:phospholipase D-like domain-containing protein [Geotalea sp. SG265]
MSILKEGVNCKGVYKVRETGLLVDACDYYRAFYHAALHARHNILMAGWQFDSEVRLLRGSEAQAAAGDVRFLPFLESLCEKKPQLEIYILAWDFSVFFSLEREWFQSQIFNWSTNERIHFTFDGKHAVNATHHQKFVIVDGQLAFVGGIDICSDRWDDRRHLEHNPERRNVDGTVYGAYHDIQSYHRGPVVRELLEVFQARWTEAGGEPIIFPTVNGHLPPVNGAALPLSADSVAISRTQARDFLALREKIQEIRRLFIDGIMAAERLIYLENQYFSSQAIYRALVSRMKEPQRPKLQIVMILPDRLPFTEELFLGLPQMRMLNGLREVAAETGHRLGIYSTVCTGNGERKMTFIHSKLMLVDDRFLTIGSANATNRSLGLDTELNMSWEADGTSTELAASIRRVRVSLLAEHAAMEAAEAEDRFAEIDGLVDYLDNLAEDGESRLCPYQPDSALEGMGWQGALEPVARIVDPERPHVEEFVFENLSRFETSRFLRGILLLGQWFSCL